jgi:hypothetical protein
MSMHIHHADSADSSSLADRVRQRVEDANARLRQRRTTDAAASEPALRRVYRDMGRAQRAIRRRTGRAPVAAVRTAALAFAEAPSLAALVTVAASLEAVDLLGW